MKRNNVVILGGTAVLSVAIDDDKFVELKRNTAIPKATPMIDTKSRTSKGDRIRKRQGWMK